MMAPNTDIDDRYELAFKLYPYKRSRDQDTSEPNHHPVVIIGAGPVGLALALDLGIRRVPVLLLDDHEGPGSGSKAICFAKRTLEISDRLGSAEPMLQKGVVWSKGKVFYDRSLLYEFDLQPDSDDRFPPFINLQQPYFEKLLYEKIEAASLQGAPIEIRGKNRVVSVSHGEKHVELSLMTPDGTYHMTADWVVACDGARSTTRTLLGLGFEGRVFEDNFLIADVKMKADFPTERWFWFEPHFRSGASALLHKQPDDVWRIDFQLGWEIDRATEMRPENVRARVDAMLGQGAEYDLIWTSIYTFQCRRMKSFRHGRVLFAGDAAHQVSPFGARGANSGIQDADNLAWKLQLVVGGLAPSDLLDTYSEERVSAADENILHSTLSTDFITPKTAVSRMFRNEVLSLAANAPFAQKLVNSGSLSVPHVYKDSRLNGPDQPEYPSKSRPGSPVQETRTSQGWLLSLLARGFTLVGINCQVPDRLETRGLVIEGLNVSSTSDDALQRRFLGPATQAVYLIRPDQHVAARWGEFDEQAVITAISTAMGVKKCPH